MSLIETILLTLLAPCILICVFGCIILICYCAIKKVASDAKQKTVAERTYVSSAGSVIDRLASGGSTMRPASPTGVFSGKETVHLAVILISCVVCLSCVADAYQISQISTNSYQSCTDMSSLRSIKCNNQGMYTTIQIDIQHPHTLGNATIGPLLWNLVRKNVSSLRNNHLTTHNAMNECDGVNVCTKLQHAINVSVYVQPVRSAQLLSSVVMEVPYGYYFDVFDFDDRRYLRNETLFSLPAAPCTGWSAELDTHYLNFNRSEANLNLTYLVPFTGVCGAHPDINFIRTMRANMVVNGFSGYDAGICDACPASMIPSRLAGRTVPFGQCRVHALAANGRLLTEYSVRMDAANRNIPEYINLTSVDSSSDHVMSWKGWARGLVRNVGNNITNDSPNVGYSPQGYIVLCGDPQTTSLRLLGQNTTHLLRSPGAVPTASWFGHNFMWFYLPSEEFETQYGPGCGKIGGLGGMSHELYRSPVRLLEACTATEHGSNMVDGVCVPGYANNTTPTPCRVASILNDFSAQWIAWRAHGSIGPAPTAPKYLPPRWNADHPNYHLGVRNGQIYLVTEDKTRDSKSMIDVQLEMDVGTDLATYAQVISEGIITRGVSYCNYDLDNNAGVLSVEVCNVGESTQTFVVRLQQCVQQQIPIAFSEGALPLKIQITEQTSTIGNRCQRVTWDFSSSNNTELKIQLNGTGDAGVTELPLFVQECMLQLTDVNGTVVFGDNDSPFDLPCFVYSTACSTCDDPGSGGGSNDDYGLGCALTFKCPEQAVAIYSMLLTILVLFVFSIVFLCLCVKEKKKNKEIASQMSDDDSL